MTILFVGIALAVSIVVGSYLFDIIFTGSDDFWECFRFVLIPDLVSLLQGRYLEDMVKSYKFSGFMLAVCGSGGLTYWGLSSWLG